MQNVDHSELITNMSVRDYFHESFNQALTNQNKFLSPETSFYIVNLLTQFSDTNKVFIKVENRLELKPLAFIYSDAINSPNRQQRIACFKYLGDITLFISGIYSYSLNRSLVDVDYYIGIGENAYHTLVDHTHSQDNSAFQIIFSELSEQFPAIVELLNEVSDNMQTHQHEDVLRLYEVWLKTGNRFCAEKLREHGIEPNQSYQHRTH